MKVRTPPQPRTPRPRPRHAAAAAVAAQAPRPVPRPTQRRLKRRMAPGMTRSACQPKPPSRQPPWWWQRLRPPRSRQRPWTRQRRQPRRPVAHVPRPRRQAEADRRPIGGAETPACSNRRCQRPETVGRRHAAIHQKVTPGDEAAVRPHQQGGDVGHFVGGAGTAHCAGLDHAAVAGTAGASQLIARQRGDDDARADRVDACASLAPTHGLGHHAERIAAPTRRAMAWPMKPAPTTTTTSFFIIDSVEKLVSQAWLFASSALVVGRKDVACHADGGYGAGPACIEGQVGGGLDQFSIAEPVGLRAGQVAAQLIRAVHGDQCGHRDQAAITLRQGGRAHTWPNSTSSVSWANWGAMSPNSCWPWEGAVEALANTGSGRSWYCVSVTGSSQSAALPFSTSVIAVWVMALSGAAPCQCLVWGGMCTTSPTRISSTGPPQRWMRPTPAVTIRVWPSGWLCQWVRAPGLKLTAPAELRSSPLGTCSISTLTCPVKYCSGAALTGRLPARVICRPAPAAKAASGAAWGVPPAVKRGFMGCSLKGLEVISARHERPGAQDNGRPARGCAPAPRRCASSLQR